MPSLVLSVIDKGPPGCASHTQPDDEFERLVGRSHICDRGLMLNPSAGERQAYLPLANPLHKFVGPLQSDKAWCLVLLRFCRAANSRLESSSIGYGLRSRQFHKTFDSRESSGTGLREASILQSPTCCITIERMTWTLWEPTWIWNQEHSLRRPWKHSSAGRCLPDRNPLGTRLWKSPKSRNLKIAKRGRLTLCVP